ncbi:hypothetical protein PCC82_00920 [Agrobacterium deltaense]
MIEQLPNVSALDANNFPRHRWYFFKEAFSPAIVDHAMEASDLKPGDRVVDPFSGSGTTPLAATMAGLIGAGTEVNPFMAFVARAKSTHSTNRRFGTASKKALSGMGDKQPHWLETFSTFSEHAELGQKRGKWLFNSEVLRAFGGGWEASRNLNPSERNLVQLCLIGAAMDVANAAKDGKCLRYRKDWQQLRLGRDDFEQAFLTRVSMVSEDIEKAPLKDRYADIKLGDSRSKAFDEAFDLCVTSPPYLNSFDYTDVYRPELFLGEFVRNMGDLQALRLATLRSHVQAKWTSPSQTDFGKHYEEASQELRKRSTLMWDRRLPEMVQAYFEDMANVLLLMRSKAKPKASLSLIVSTSAYCGVEIPVDLIIADIAIRNGWFLREVTVLRYLKRLSGQQWHALNDRSTTRGPHLRESMVVIDAQPRRLT